MDLAELKFVVQTEQLDEAATKIKQLAVEVNKLNKPMQDLSNNTNKVSAATEKASKATENKSKVDTKVVDTSSKLDGLLDKLNNRYTDMAKGSTSAEAGVLQLARSLGATTEEALKPYKAILESIRELSKSPFDSAIGSVRSITQEYDSMTYRAELAAKGIFLTTTQLKEYSRIANEIKGKLKAADLDPTKGEGLAKFNSELKVQQDLYLGIANKVNTLKIAEKERNDLLSSQMKESARLQEASDNLFKYNLIRHKQDQDGYKQDMSEMSRYYSELEKKSSANQTSQRYALKQSSDDLFRLNQLKQDSTHKVYQLDMQELRKYYSALEQEGNKNSEMLQKSSDEMFRMNQLRHKQDQDGYARDMQEMRKYYSALEKQSKQSVQSQPAQMDSAVDVYHKNQAKAADDAAKANAYLAKEMERVNRLTASNGDLTSATNNKLIKFEQSLRASGRSAAEVTTQLAAYKAQLLSTQKAAGNRQIDYLSRALGPQITDIAVGLATGQAPLTILLQQGGQLRDQFALAGVAGSQMGDMLVKATSSMVTSVKDVGVAIGSAFIGAINNSGKAITKFAMDITGANNVLENLRYQIALFEKGSSGPMMSAFRALGTAITFMTGLLLTGAVVALVAFGVALNAVIKEENALNRALNLTGAAMGVSLDMAYDAARGMEEFGVSTGTALEVLTEMAKMGGMSADSLEMVSTTAQAMKTAFDIPIADTVKKFKELQEKPTESLTKLAVQLGTIPVEVLKQVDAYERAGDSVKAAQLATETYAKAGKDAAARVVEDFGTITRLGISIGEIWDKTWESIMGIGRKGTLSDQITKIRESLPGLRAQVAPDADVNDYDAQQLELAESQLRALLDKAAAEKNLAVENKANAEAAKTFEDDKKKRDEAANKIKADAKSLQNAFNSELEKARDYYIGQVGALNHLTKAETTLLKIKASTIWSSFNEEQRKYIELLYGAAGANERNTQSEKDSQTALELKNKLLGKSEGLGKDYYNTIAQINELAAKGKFGANEVKELTAALQAATPEAKRLAAAQASGAKTLADIAADRAGIAQEYQGDFKTSEEKAAIKNLSDYRKSVASADAEYNKSLADAGNNVTIEEWDLYQEVADAKKAKAEERYNREQYLLTDSYKQQQAYSDAFKDLFKGMGDAIVDFALTGKTSFGDMVKSIIVGLIKMQVQMQMMNAFKSMGFKFADGGAFTSGGVQAFAKGGTFTNSVVDSPTMFKFAKGAGVMGEAGPEAIMPLRRGSDGSLGVVAAGSSGSNVSVQVINNSNAQATTNETVDSKGNRKIEVVIGDMTAGEISRSGSASNKSIRSTFGIQPQLIRR